MTAISQNYSPGETGAACALFSRRTVFLIFIAALATRLLLFSLARPWDDSWVYRQMQWGDPLEYVTLAKSLLERGEFSITWPVAMPNAIRTPGYPVFLALTSGAHYGLLPLVALLQVIFDSAMAVLLAFLVARCFASVPVGILSGFVYALTPEIAWWSTQLFVEAFSLWLCIGAVWSAAVLSGRFGSAGFGKCAAAVSLLAAMLLVKPNLLVLWLCCMAFVGISVLLCFTWRKFLLAGLAILIAATPLALWTYRNYITWGVATPSFAVQTTRAMVVMAATKAMNLDLEVPTSQVLNLHSISADPSQADFLPKKVKSVYEWDHDVLRRDNLEYARLFRDFVRDHPGWYIRTHLFGVCYMLLSPGPRFFSATLGLSPASETSAGFITRESSKAGPVSAHPLRVPAQIIWSAIVLTSLCLIYPLFLLGIIQYMWQSKWLAASNPWLVYLVAAILTTLALGAAGTFRYRAALLVALLPFVSIGAMFVYRKIMERWKRGSV